MWWLTPPDRPRALQLPRLLYEQALAVNRNPPMRLDWKSRGVYYAERDSYPTWYPGPFTGRVVMDVGAGCGETADYFLKHGAKFVIAIEPDEKKASLLRANMKGRPVYILQERFALWMLSLPHDYLKFDAEGAESLLLDYESSLGPCAIETHATLSKRKNIASALCARFGLRVYARVSPTSWILGKP